MTPSATPLLLIGAVWASSLVGSLARDCPAQPWHAPDETIERLPPVERVPPLDGFRPVQRAPEPESQPYEPVFRGPYLDPLAEQPRPAFALAQDDWSQRDGLGSPSYLEDGLGSPSYPGAPTGPLQTSGPHGEWSGYRGRLWAEVCELKCKVVADHRNFYSWPTGRDFAIGLGLGAVLANTSLDQDFRDWYQRDVRSSGTDNFSSFSKVFGEGQIFIPAYAGLALLDVFCDDLPVLGTAGDFSARVSRAYLVGAPPMLLMQVVTGASRPGEAPYESRWSPLDDNNGVSGHAFIGAVPFITAARMCENPWLKGGLYVCSTLTAWSRVNDDCHYLSQAWLGWWMAYLACRAVDRTDSGDRQWSLVPLAGPQVMGVGLVITR